jgi:hypothetical protein
MPAMPGRGEDWRPRTHPSVPPLPDLQPPARTAFEVTPRQVVLWGIPMTALALVFTGAVSSDGPGVSDPAVVGTCLVTFAFIGWWCVQDVRHGDGWLAVRRWSRWKWVDLTALDSGRLHRPPVWPSTTGHYSKNSWAIELQDKEGRRVKVPALALRDEELRMQVNVALREGNLPDIGSLMDVGG